MTTSSRRWSYTAASPSAKPVAKITAHYFWGTHPSSTCSWLQMQRQKGFSDDDILMLRSGSNGFLAEQSRSTGTGEVLHISSRYWGIVEHYQKLQSVKRFPVVIYVNRVSLNKGDFDCFGYFGRSNGQSLFFTCICRLSQCPREANRKHQLFMRKKVYIGLTLNTAAVLTSKLSSHAKRPSQFTLRNLYDSKHSWHFFRTSYL